MQLWISLDGKTSVDGIVRKSRLGYRGTLQFAERTNWSTIYRWTRTVPIDRLTIADAKADIYRELQEVTR